MKYYADMPDVRNQGSLTVNLLFLHGVKTAHPNTDADMPEWSNGRDLGSRSFCLHRFESYYPHWVSF